MQLDLQELRKSETQPFRLLKTRDDKHLFLREWRADSQSTTAVLIFHGITAHSKPYDVIATPISNEGFDVYGLDLRGHGLSDGIRGDYKSKGLLMADIELALKHLNHEYDNIVLLGHSLGIIVAIMAINHFPDLISGIILLSGARKTRRNIYPKRSVFTTLRYLVSSILRPSKPVIKYHREGMLGTGDPVFNFKYTLRFLRTINAKNMFIPKNRTQPLLMGIGDHDELFTVDAARELFDEFDGDKEFTILEGAKHAEFPKNLDESRIISWLQEKFR